MALYDIVLRSRDGSAPVHGFELTDEEAGLLLRIAGALRIAGEAGGPTLSIAVSPPPPSGSVWCPNCMTDTMPGERLRRDRYVDHGWVHVECPTEQADAA